MKTASKIFYYFGVALIIATAIIVIVRLHGKSIVSQQTQDLAMEQVRMVCYHAIASGCCFGLSKILDRD